MTLQSKPPTRLFLTTTKQTPYQQTSRDKLSDYIKAVHKTGVDKMKTFNDLDYWFNYEQGQAKLEKRNPVFTVPMYKIMKALIDNLHYRNLYIDSRENLSKVLGCSVNKINSKLSLLDRSLVKVSKASKGNIRIEVNPCYGFKYKALDLNYARELQVKTWLLEWSSGEP